MLWDLPTQDAFSIVSPATTPSPRFARYFVENGTNHRHLFKVFGIRFDILVDGKVSISVRSTETPSGPASACWASVVTDDGSWVGFIPQFSVGGRGSSL